MAQSTLFKIGKALMGSPSSQKTKAVTHNSILINNIFKKRNDLVNLTEAERLACDIFSKFYSSLANAITVKEESLPLTTYANCIRTLRLKLEQDASPAQMVSVLWGKMTIAASARLYKSECLNFNRYRYSPNYEHEKTLIFAGLMVVVSLSFPNKEKIEDIISAIRTSAHSKENKEYFRPFDLAINTFDPKEITIGLIDAINAIKTATKPYKALALYEFLISQFANDEYVKTYIENECSTVPKEEPEIGTRIETLTVGNGGAMTLIEGGEIHTSGPTALPSNDTKKTNRL